MFNSLKERLKYLLNKVGHYLPIPLPSRPHYSKVMGAQKRLKYFASRFLIGICLMSSLYSTSVCAKTAPGVAGALSLIPGLGQVSNGDVAEGGVWFVTALGLFLIPGDASLRQIGWDLWQYNMYDAYRDAGAKGAAKYNVFENYVAAFNPLNIIDPIGAPILALGALVRGNDGNIPGIPRSLFLRPLVYGFVGLGEEGLFRGFLFPGLSDVFSSKIAGAITSSVLFAFFHITNGRSDIDGPHLASRTIMGLLFCWQTHLQKNDLRHSIFTHSWWDFLVTRNGGTKGSVGFKFSF